MARFFRDLMDVLFPPRCVFCRRFLKRGQEDGICPECRGSLPYAAGDGIRVRGADRCAAALYYRGNVRSAIHRFKFRGVSGYATTFGHLLAESVKRNYAGGYDLITWVPVSSKRKEKRGYDQAMLLAMAAAIELDDVAVETIVKTVDVPSQTKIKSHDRRRANVLGAFEVRDVELVSGKRILLIDDIVTSGSTLSECAHMLKTAGAASVLCAVLADAGGNRNQREN